MASTDRKKWTTPKLKVLVRMRTEERVLDYCKGDYLQLAQNFRHNKCRRLMPAMCQEDCSQIAPS